MQLFPKRHVLQRFSNLSDAFPKLSTTVDTGSGPDSNPGYPRSTWNEIRRPNISTIDALGKERRKRDNVFPFADRGAAKATRSLSHENECHTKSSPDSNLRHATVAKAATDLKDLRRG
jgi:hypothetical protein